MIVRFARRTLKNSFGPKNRRTIFQQASPSIGNDYGLFFLGVSIFSLLGIDEETRKKESHEFRTKNYGSYFADSFVKHGLDKVKVFFSY